jgi:hypothetical protein
LSTGSLQLMQNIGVAQHVLRQRCDASEKEIGGLQQRVKNLDTVQHPL